jgi:hypothetical protein
MTFKFGNYWGLATKQFTLIGLTYHNFTSNLIIIEFFNYFIEISWR